MAEQTFRSPNFFEREVDLSAPTQGAPFGVPAGIIGAANKGPAFVPITFSNFSEFTTTFGNLDPKKPAEYAVNQFLNNRNSLTFLRVLGAGANSSSADIQYTQTTGRVINSGLTLNADTHGDGGVMFLTTVEDATSLEPYTAPMFTDNDSVVNPNSFQLVRGALLMATGTRAMVFGDVGLTVANFAGALNDGGAGTSLSGLSSFKLVISSSNGASFASDDGIPGVKIFSASFNPTSPNYISKILNVDSNRFGSQMHLLYAHMPVDNEISVPASVLIASGSAATGVKGLSYRNLFGTLDTRFKTPKSPMFISQPFGAVEHDLFKLESLDDGEYANSLYKISITNLKMSVDPSNPYGSFSVQIRDWNDSDFSPNVLEEFNNCDLNPLSSNYVANVIGDRKVYYNFDTDVPTEKRLLATGKFNNKSKYVRVLVSNEVETGNTPKNALPFGFKGPQLLKTSDLQVSTGNGKRLLNSAGGVSPLLPPIPFRFKVTRGEMISSLTPGLAGPLEVVNPNFYWGVKFERNNSTTGDPNSIVERNELLSNLTKFMGIYEMDSLLTGSNSDAVNNNKFTLAKVAFNNGSINDVTASANVHMLNTAYLRNGVVDPNDYRINQRVTFASLVNAFDTSYTGINAPTAAANFNRFTTFLKFNTFMYGGYDGVNFLDKNSVLLNDKSVSFASNGGGAASNYVPEGFIGGYNPAGSQKENNGVVSYQAAVDIMTDPFTSNINVLAIPGIREPYIADYTGNKVKDYGLALYVMDIPSYDDSYNVIFDDSVAKPNIENTASALETRQIDNDYIATYLPDVFINDATNNRKVKVPASVAALSALGFNDRVAYPWFAPAGFNRAALDFVTNVAVRLNVSDRDRLYDARINPIATFPRQGFVIYGQKTLKINKSALDRVNVRRLLLEVKRKIIQIAQRITFEQNTPDVRNKFVAEAAVQLGLVQAQAGIEAYQVVMNESNNTQDDIDNNRLRGRIVVVPTRAIEFIALDFIVTNSGVQFA